MDDGLPHWVIIQHFDECLQLVLFSPRSFFTDLSTGRTSRSYRSWTRVVRLVCLASCRTSDGQVDVGMLEVDSWCDGRHGLLRVGGSFATD